MSKNPIVNSAASPISAKQRRAILLLVSGSTATQVAQAVGVSKGTVYNWKSQRGEFRDELEAAQRRAYEEGVRQLQCLVAKAASSLSSILDSPAEADRDKISAARTVLQFTELTPTFDERPSQIQSGPDEFLKRMGLL